MGSVSIQVFAVILGRNVKEVCQFLGAEGFWGELRVLCLPEKKMIAAAPHAAQALPIQRTFGIRSSEPADDGSSLSGRLSISSSISVLFSSSALKYFLCISLGKLFNSASDTIFISILPVDIAVLSLDKHNRVLFPDCIF